MLNSKIKKYLKELDNWPENKYKEFPDEIEIYRKLTILSEAKEPFLLNELKEKLKLSTEDQCELFSFMFANKRILRNNDFQEYLTQIWPIPGKLYWGTYAKIEFLNFFFNNLNVFNYWEERANKTKNQLLKFHYLDRILFYVDAINKLSRAKLSKSDNLIFDYFKKNIIKFRQQSIFSGLEILKIKNVKQYILFIILKRILHLSRMTDFFETKKIENIAQNLFNEKNSFEMQQCGSIVELSIGKFIFDEFQQKEVKQKTIFYPSLWIFNWLFFNEETKINFEPSDSKIFKTFGNKILKHQEQWKEDFSFMKDTFIVMTNYHFILDKKSECWEKLFEQLKILKYSLDHGYTKIINFSQKYIKLISKNDENEVRYVLDKICDFSNFFTENKSKNVKQNTHISNFWKWRTECLFYLQEIEKKRIINDFPKNNSKKTIIIFSSKIVDISFSWNYWYLFDSKFDQIQKYKKLFNKNFFSSKSSLELEEKLSKISFCFFFGSNLTKDPLKWTKKNNFFKLSKIQLIVNSSFWFSFGSTKILSKKTLILELLMKKLYNKKNEHNILNILKNKDFFAENIDIFNNFRLALQIYIKKEYFATCAILVTIIELILRYWFLKDNKQKLSIFKPKNWSNKCHEYDFKSLNELIQNFDQIIDGKNFTNFNQIILGSKIIENLKILFQDEQLRNRIAHSSNIKELQEPHPANWLFQVIYLLTSFSITD